MSLRTDGSQRLVKVYYDLDPHGREYFGRMYALKKEVPVLANEGAITIASFDVARTQTGVELMIEWFITQLPPPV
jgi:hypothetical protein